MGKPNRVPRNYNFSYSLRKTSIFFISETDRAGPLFEEIWYMDGIKSINNVPIFKI